jgi:hypothetical protein
LNRVTSYFNRAAAASAAAELSGIWYRDCTAILMRVTACFAIILVLALPLSAAAQSDAPARKLIMSERAIAAAVAAHPPAQPPPARDSLKNGAIIGAIAGAVVFGGFVTFLCNALQEPSDPSCLGSSLVAIAIGAGGGAAAGAGVDALFYRPQHPFVRSGLPRR